MIYGLGDKLVRLREGKHLQQKDIAKYSKVTPQAISGYENDTATPSLEVFSDLCAFYNASADYLLGLISSMITKLKEVRQAEKSDD